MLRPKGFEVREPDEAGIWISVYFAVENEVPLKSQEEVIDEPAGYEWVTELRTAIHRREIGDAATFAKATLILNGVDSKSQRVFWRAAAMGNVFVEVDQEERERRLREAISSMLSQFPPPAD